VHVRGGLAVTTGERDALLPDISTAREAGVPDVEAVNWAGYVVHSGKPSGTGARLNAETVKILNLAEVRESMRAQGLTAAPSSPEQFAALLKSDGARYTKSARAANIRLD
jgi:tripartite-type tricarboxylate transporter receptor subunit TctC